MAKKTTDVLYEQNRRLVTETSRYIHSEEISVQEIVRRSAVDARSIITSINFLFLQLCKILSTVDADPASLAIAIYGDDAVDSVTHIETTRNMLEIGKSIEKTPMFDIVTASISSPLLSGSKKVSIPSTVDMEFLTNMIDSHALAQFRVIFKNKFTGRR